jgi:hypothetical protein
VSPGNGIIVDPGQTLFVTKKVIKVFFDMNINKLCR